MKMSVSFTMQQTYHDLEEDGIDFVDWIKRWPTQLLLAVMEIRLTHRLSKIFAEHEKRAKKIAGYKQRKMHLEVQKI